MGPTRIQCILYMQAMPGAERALAVERRGSSGRVRVRVRACSTPRCVATPATGPAHTTLSQPSSKGRGLGPAALRAPWRTIVVTRGPRAR